ncbi:DinB superfamily protein [Solitalea longa]|uniref:DinB superfamily protein n=1 Tax=Solitalea longa TaxID=2079460 RepID=A0A2S5A623_9SPHI|nr:DUF1572 family protein [Solitalea longa]POY37782.1 DinB superfamily protein [Solitalea longa]
MLPTLKALYTRDLLKLKAEIEAYRKEENIWKTDGAIANSAGNLCLHLIGNLNHYIGNILGGSGYVRNRELEFSQKNVPLAELFSMIDCTITVVDQSLDKISFEQLKEEYPILVFTEKTSVEFLIVHLVMHLSYHLGQISYHRRLLDN